VFLESPAVSRLVQVPAGPAALLPAAVEGSPSWRQIFLEELLRGALARRAAFPFERAQLHATDFSGDGLRQLVNSMRRIRL
jgi:hypothetical protein